MAIDGGQLTVCLYRYLIFNRLCAMWCDLHKVVSGFLNFSITLNLTPPPHLHPTVCNKLQLIKNINKKEKQTKIFISDVIQDICFRNKLKYTAQLPQFHELTTR